MSGAAYRMVAAIEALAAAGAELTAWATAHIAIANELRDQGYPYAMAQDVADVHAAMKDGHPLSMPYDRLIVERIRERPEFTDAAED